jgi:hypothetical protein
MKRYHLELMLSSGTTCYHLGLHVIIWDAMSSSGANVIIWEKMLSSGAIVIMVSSVANVIIWCYHVMLSSGMITHPFFIFPENFTHSFIKPFPVAKFLVPDWGDVVVSDIGLSYDPPDYVGWRAGTTTNSCWSRLYSPLSGTKNLASVI